MEVPEFFTLKNGLKICLIPDKNVDTVTLNLKGLAGSNEEDLLNNRKELGIAHITEHASIHNRYLPNLGDKGARVIGVTSRADVLFMVKVLSEDLNIALKFLNEVISFKEFTTDNIENSKILSSIELQRSRNQISRILSQGILTTRYKDQRPAFPNLGSVKQILDISESMIIAFKERNYVPDKFVLVISGNFDTPEIKESIWKFFGVIKSNSNENINEFIPNLGRKAITINKKNLINRSVKINYLGCNSKEKDLFKNILLMRIIDMRMKKRFRDKKAYTYSSSAIYHATSYWGHASVILETEPKSLEKVILELPNIVKKIPISPQELKHGKKNIEVQTKFNLEKLSARAEYYSNILLHGAKNQTHVSDLQKIDKISLEQINETQQNLFGNNPIGILIGYNPNEMEIQSLLLKL